MKPNEIIKEINNLALDEKLMLVEDIWDSIAKSNAELPIHEWQKAELNKRYKKYKNGELKLHNMKEVHSELRDQYK